MMERQLQITSPLGAFEIERKGERLMDKQRVADAYERYADTVVKAAWHYTGDAESAQDCAEEAFLKLMSQKDMTNEHILPWLIRTAVNIAKNEAKSAHRTKTQALDELTSSAGSDERVLARRAAARAMLSLPEKYRLPLMLHLAQGMTILETSNAIGKSMNTTASLIHRGKKLLQKAFEKEEL